MDGNLIACYPSVREAERHGFDSSGIVRCCKGEYYQYKGYTWWYKEDVD